ncbi:MAG: class I SAM-dependent RNA methyltransferase [Sedimentisphaerales bacterium]|nr:class I SAM-dependent RNA methyltransferase [Sedimentisphaerales bacterium]
MNPKQKSTILITSSEGLVDYVRREVEDLGYQSGDSHKTGLEVEGDLYDTMRLNLYLRTAHNVLFLLKQFKCNGPDELYRNVKRLPWEEIISPQEYVSVVGKVNTALVGNSMYANLKVKDAIVDRIAGKTGSRPDSGKDKNKVVVQFYWKDDYCWVYLNTSGQKLSDRGYRKMPHKAPLRESLAAAIIIATGYDGSEPLICPMCGSGTLAIEAALIASRRPPGLLRSNYGFMHVKYFDEPGWRQMRGEALKMSKMRGGKADFKPARIIATDIDAGAVEAARKNAMTAGVSHLIDFDVCDFGDTVIPPGAGIVIMNPEYGLRLGEIEKLQKIYKRIGDFFKQKCAGYTGYIFTGNPALAKKVELRTSRRFEFYNANIECRLLKYELYTGTKKKM